ncbi:hypothetical protein P7D22_13315 [Lichenihabitans sp. Uapishka_5]|uniref:hypothetical protein n=1 Tax=Lichenihabitans sp. Uapishka_5 TaxID=3037302 RepID=UPI0029E8166A|nr:hypothetical protein [Lichenihabitans sp. Uapishka_5]MDX7952154.1 hypothetical protein [Lichenihabitans sp. Uapishka_5]
MLRRIIVTMLLAAVASAVTPIKIPLHPPLVSKHATALYAPHLFAWRASLKATIHIAGWAAACVVVWGAVIFA